MAISHVLTTSGQADGVSSVTVSITVSAGGQLIVKSSAEDNANAAHLPITGITFNGSAFTKRVSQDDVSSENDRTEIWDHLSPAATTADLVITYTDIVDGLVYSIEEYTGIDSFDTSTSTAVNATTGPAQVSITTSVANCLLVDAAQTLSSSRTLTANSGQTQTYNIQNAGQLKAAGGYEIVTTATSYTQSWTIDALADWIICVASYKPVASTSVKDFIGGGFIPFAR